MMAYKLENERRNKAQSFVISEMLFVCCKWH